MTKDVFDQIAGGLEEALAIAKGHVEPHRMYVPAEIDVKSIREKTGLTQKDFSSFFAFSLDQVKQWEQGRSRPVQAMRAYLLLISNRPKQMMELLREVHDEMEMESNPRETNAAESAQVIAM
ncbi:MAG: transcriptional regulator [Roseibium sp.]